MVQGLVSEKLIAEVSPDWWQTDEGQEFLKRQRLRQEWVNFLEPFGFDVWFTLSFDEKKILRPQTAGLALDRTVRLLRKACKGVDIECNAFVIAEPHKGGTYHTHGMMRLDTLGKEFETIFLRHFWQVAFEIYGRNRFSRIECDSAVRYYVAKYVTKRAFETEWQIIGCKRG